MNERASTVPPPWVALTFVALALATFGAVALLLITGVIVQPLALLHGLALGVFGTVALGLLYQFVPVVAQRPLRCIPLAVVHALLACAGTALLVTGFQTLDFGLVRLGGEAHLAGLLCEGIVLVTTLFGHAPPAPARGASLSLVWLALTMALGVWMASALARGTEIGAWIAPHALAGLAGFFGTIITAVTFRLLRMFERVNEEVRSGPFALGVSFATVLGIAAGRLGAVALVAVGVLFGIDLARIAGRRDPAYQPETLAYAVVSGLGALAAAVAYVLDAPDRAVIFALWFFIGTAVVGYLQRIVPFIWWIRRSRREGGARAIPTLGQMNSSTLGYAVLALWCGAGAWFMVAPYAFGAGIVALAAWLALLAQLARPFLLKRPVET